MTKSLEQIQQENRKFILEAIGEYKNELKLLEQQEHQIYHEIISKSFYSKSLTLSRVLLVFSGKIFKNKISLQFPDFLHVNGFNWNLTKETLEEQNEKTQMAINKLFNNLTNKN